MSNENKKGKVLYMSDSNRATGFGVVADHVCKALSTVGYEVYLVGWGFRSSEPMIRDGYALLPCGNDAFGADVLGQYIYSMKPDIMITQADIRMVSWIPELMKKLPTKPTWVLYPVIDGNIWSSDSKRKLWPSNWTEVIKVADKVIAMTDYGKDILSANGVASDTIYHGIDTTQFFPAKPETREEIKANAGLPSGSFIVGGVFKNMQRKNPQQYLQAFKIFIDKLPPTDKEKCMLLLHTQPRPSTGAEFDLIQQSIDYGLEPGKNVLFSAGMLPMCNMQNLYQSMDIYLQLGGMEGFCLPLIEAMSCGLPIIALDSSTHSELLADTGLISPAPHFKSNKLARITYGSYNGVECDIADPWDVADKMFALYNNKALRESLSVKTTERATRLFDLSVINQKWIDLVKSLIITEDMIPDQWKALMKESLV